MFESFGAFFEALWQARFGFAQLWEWICGVYQSAISMPGLVEIKTSIDTFFAPFLGVLPYVLIALCVVIAFAGRKILSVLKFITFFFFGFVLGAYYISPILWTFVGVPSWAVGLAIGIIAAVLYRLVYYLLYGTSILFLVYNLCYTGFTFQPQEVHLQSRAITCIAIAAVVTVLAFVFRKYVEMLGTAVLGGYLVFLIVNFMIFDMYTLEFIWHTPWIAPVVITSVIALPGFLVQYKFRKRY
ncbi:MAG: hypothetical protein IJD51_06340 [Clostridia bacterium]|nr:hypothetical protein [Clostridia bacterium]